jgi:hypothetical protein
VETKTVARWGTVFGGIAVLESPAPNSPIGENLPAAPSLSFVDKEFLWRDICILIF